MMPTTHQSDRERLRTLAIRAMRERLRPFGGDLQISSGGDGTRVAVSIPLSRPDASEQIEPARAAM